MTAEAGHKITKIHVLLLSENSTSKELKLAFERTGLYRVTEMALKDAKTRYSVMDLKVAAFVVDCNVFDRRELVATKNMTDWLESVPALVLADQISLFSYRRIEALKNTISIQKPCDYHAVISVVNRMVVGHNVKPRTSPRFITDMPAKLMHLKSGLLISTRMRNYSATGAFFEYKGLSFRVGDQIEVKLDTQDPESLEMSLLIKAKVVWIKEGEQQANATTSQIRGIGVQFFS